MLVRQERNWSSISVSISLSIGTAVRLQLQLVQTFNHENGIPSNHLDSHAQHTHSQTDRQTPTSHEMEMRRDEMR